MGRLWVRGEERGGRIRGFWGVVELEFWWVGDGSIDEEVDYVLDRWCNFRSVPLLVLHKFRGMRDVCLVEGLQERLRL